MPIWRVNAMSETFYTAVIEADSAADAGVKLGDQIRAGETEPTTGPTITSIEIQIKEDD